MGERVTEFKPGDLVAFTMRPGIGGYGFGLVDSYTVGKERYRLTRVKYENLPNGAENGTLRVDHARKPTNEETMWYWERWWVDG